MVWENQISGKLQCHRLNCDTVIYPGAMKETIPQESAIQPELEMTIKLSSDGFALVNSNWKMLDAKRYPPPPSGTMICGNSLTGKSVISTWDSKYGFTHWAPLPVFP